MLHSYKILVLLLAIITVSACKKNLSTQQMSFDVSADSASITRGSFAFFRFTGNPDNITFYSGTWGMRYQNAYRYTDTSGTDVLTFSTAVNTAGTSGSLSLLYSTDFAGDTSRTSNATWTDISTLSPVAWATGTSAVASGNIDLTSLKAAGKPIYLAFKYVATAGTTQKKWTITPLSLIHKPTGDTTYTILNLTGLSPAYAAGTPALVASPGWVAVNQSRNTVAAQLWSPLVSTTSNANFVIAGATVAASATASEQWLIAGPIDLTRVLHDVPTSVIKNISSLSAENIAPPFSFRYTLPGTYTAAFLGVNAGTGGLDSLVKTVGIQVK